MNIGEWEIEKTGEKILLTEPDNPNSPVFQRWFFYNFTYLPTNFKIDKTVVILKPYTEETLLAHLTELTVEMKGSLILG